MDKLLEQLKAYEKLEDGWDGEGSKAPKKESLAQARAFIKLLPKEAPKTREAHNGLTK